MRSKTSLRCGEAALAAHEKTADEPNDWTKCLLGHAGLRGSIADPLTLLEIEDRQVLAALIDPKLTGGSVWHCSCRGADIASETIALAQRRRLFGAAERGACVGDDAGRVLGPGVIFSERFLGLRITVPDPNPPRVDDAHGRCGG
jgi:hypothetical protein